jgi:hypothetical protein
VTLQLLSQAHISLAQRKGTTNTEWKLAAFQSYCESADLVPSYGRIPARRWDMLMGSCLRDVVILGESHTGVHELNLLEG